MTNQPSKPIMLFDCKTSQSVIGQDKFLDSFKTILNHGGYAQGPETRELDENWPSSAAANIALPAVPALML